MHNIHTSTSFQTPGLSGPVATLLYPDMLPTQFFISHGRQSVAAVFVLNAWLSHLQPVPVCHKDLWSKSWVSILGVAFDLSSSNVGGLFVSLFPQVPHVQEESDYRFPFPHHHLLCSKLPGCLQQQRSDTHINICTCTLTKLMCERFQFVIFHPQTTETTVK